MAEDLTLIAGPSGNRRSIAGWTEVRVTRGIERLPSDFEVSFTERYPGQADAVVVQEGDPCEVQLGADLVITGYIDRYECGYSSNHHHVRVTGRSKCQDLVDCSVVWPKGQMRDVSMLDFAKNLAEPYGIEVKSADGPGIVIVQYNAQWGETVFAALDRYCRVAGFLAYDLPDGNLLLSRVGTRHAAGSLVEGQNVQAAQVVRGMDQRYSAIVLRLQSFAPYNDIASNPSEDVLEVYPDPGVPRFRRLYKFVHGGDAGSQIARQGAAWEAARRLARSQVIRVTADSWRDADGALWEPNTLIPVKLPRLKVTSVIGLIGQVTYRRDDSGTHADLLVMPPQGFEVEPTLAPWLQGTGDVPVGAGAR